MRGAVRLDRKLVLQEATRVADNAGGFSESWATVGTLWADVRAGTGREREIMAATISFVPHRIIVRASPYGSVSRPKAGQRMVEGARVYRLEAVAEFDVAGLYLECFAKEEVVS